MHSVWGLRTNDFGHYLIHVVVCDGVEETDDIPDDGVPNMAMIVASCWRLIEPPRERVSFEAIALTKSVSEHLDKRATVQLQWIATSPHRLVMGLVRVASGGKTKAARS